MLFQGGRRCIWSMLRPSTLTSTIRSLRPLRNPQIIARLASTHAEHHHDDLKHFENYRPEDVNQICHTYLIVIRRCRLELITSSFGR